MPTDNGKESKLSIFIDGKFHEISSPIVLEPDDGLITTVGPLGTNKRHIFEVDMKSDVISTKGLTRCDLMLTIIYGIEPDKIIQNNWRRLHGLPMKRRVKK